MLTNYFFGTICLATSYLLLTFLWGMYKKYTQRKNLHILYEKVNDILHRTKIDYWISYGTLLGHYRCDDILKGDNDIDFSMLEKDVDVLLMNMQALPKELQFYDTSHKHGGPKFYIEYCGVTADIYTYKECENNTLKVHLRQFSCHGGDKLAFPKDWIFPLKKVTFKNSFTYVPNDVKKILLHNYNNVDDQCFHDIITGYYHKYTGWFDMIKHYYNTVTLFSLLELSYQNVMLHVPNIVNYFRILFIATSHVLLSHEYYVLGSFLYVLSLLIKQIGRTVANLLVQTSHFGSVLNIIINEMGSLGLCFILCTILPQYVFILMFFSMFDISISSHVYNSTSKNNVINMYNTNGYYVADILCMGKDLFYLSLFFDNNCTIILAVPFLLNHYVNIIQLIEAIGSSCDDDNPVNITGLKETIDLSSDDDTINSDNDSAKITRSKEAIDLSSDEEDLTN